MQVSVNQYSGRINYGVVNGVRHFRVFRDGVVLSKGNSYYTSSMRTLSRDDSQVTYEIDFASNEVQYDPPLLFDSGKYNTMIISNTGFIFDYSYF